MEFPPEVQQLKLSDGEHNLCRTKEFRKTTFLFVNYEVNNKEVSSKSVSSNGNSVIETFSFLNVLPLELVCVLHFRKKSFIAENQSSHLTTSAVFNKINI